MREPETVGWRAASSRLETHAPGYDLIQASLGMYASPPPPFPPCGGHAARANQLNRPLWPILVFLSSDPPPAPPPPPMVEDSDRL